jgi:hypothetical protein
MNLHGHIDQLLLPVVSDAELGAACEDLENLCLLLSFINATCVTPIGSTRYVAPQFLAGING